MRFVIADDSYPAREVLHAAVVVDLGFFVVGSAEDGVQALALCRRLQPDVVLLDVNMSPMDGDEVAAVLAKEQPRCKIIMVTNQKIRGQEFHRKGYGFVPKPFADRGKLVKEIRRVIDG